MAAKGRKGASGKGGGPDGTKNVSGTASSGADEGTNQPAVGGKGAEAAQADVDLLNDRLLRLQADFENFRKRMLREKNDLYRLANQDLMQELMPVLDHLELALAATGEGPSADAAFLHGVRLVWEQLLSALGKFGLSPIDAEGVEFDPNLHEAISHLPSHAVPENGVISQLRRGYRLGERLLRPAQVVVSRGADDDGQGPDEVRQLEGE